MMKIELKKFTEESLKDIDYDKKYLIYAYGNTLNDDDKLDSKRLHLFEGKFIKDFRQYRESPYIGHEIFEPSDIYSCGCCTEKAYISMKSILYYTELPNPSEVEKSYD